MSVRLVRSFVVNQSREEGYISSVHSAAHTPDSSSIYTLGLLFVKGGRKITEEKAMRETLRGDLYGNFDELFHIYFDYVDKQVLFGCSACSF